MNTKTKIITTIGPSSSSKEKMSQIIKEGGNILRFNMKHATINWHSKHIEKAIKISKKIEIPIGIMIDLQGPEIRIETKNGENIGIERGDEITFSDHFINKRTILIPNKEVINVLNPGDKILIDDGFIKFEVLKRKENKIVAKAITDGIIQTQKGLNLPNKKLDLPSLIDKDLKKLELAAKHEIDFVALSFTRTAEDIKILRKEMEKRNLDAKVVAKIENQEALNNIDEVIKEADCIMIARGDLGIETPLEEIAYIQRSVIQKCRDNHTPVIVATQMLESMTVNPLPTRAEVTDVANAVFNGTDAVMLSAETAAGEYPLESVRMMDRIIEFNEKKANPSNINFNSTFESQSLVNSALEIIQSSCFPKINKIITFTDNGDIVRALSALRPDASILTITNEKKNLEELLCSYGVIPHYNIFPKEEFKKEGKIIRDLFKENLIKKEDNLLIIHDHKEKSFSLKNLSSLK